jgi:hypothetical protein
MEFVVDTAALGQIISEYFVFPCQSLIPMIIPKSPFTFQG